MARAGTNIWTAAYPSYLMTRDKKTVWAQQHCGTCVHYVREKPEGPGDVDLNWGRCTFLFKLTEDPDTKPTFFLPHLRKHQVGIGPEYWACPRWKEALQQRVQIVPEPVP